MFEFSEIFYFKGIKTEIRPKHVNYKGEILESGFSLWREGKEAQREESTKKPKAGPISLVERMFRREL